MEEKAVLNKTVGSSFPLTSKFNSLTSFLDGFGRHSRCVHNAGQELFDDRDEDTSW